jgi:pyruvate/2-oxoglutarate dehydrogenase complex dihydrolipoamide dehydrogenase (E3) component
MLFPVELAHNLEPNAGDLIAEAALAIEMGADATA